MKTVDKGKHAGGRTLPRNWQRNLRKAHKAERQARKAQR